MTPRARWSLALGGIGLAAMIVACLNPQPLPPAEARATNGEDAGTSFGDGNGADGSASSAPETDLSDGGKGDDAGDTGTDAGDDAGDAGTDAGDAGDDTTG